MLSFEQFFGGKLKEVFLYITDRCNLRCPHCYMPDSKNMDMPLNAFRAMMKELISLDASKVTFLGGEPTLHPLLPEFVDIAKKLGFNHP